MTTETEENKNTIDDLNLDIPRESRFQKTRRERLGLSTPVDYPPLPSRPSKRFFATVAMPHKVKVKFNNRLVEYRMLQTTEQYYFLRRVVHLLNCIAQEYLIIFEHCKSGDLHLHITCGFCGIAKDLRLELMDFFQIRVNNCVAVDVREVYDEEHLKNYLIEKDLKKYQTSIFPKIEKTFIISPYGELEAQFNDFKFNK